MNPEKLRVGILLDSYQMPEWLYHSIEQVVNSNFAEISLIVLNEDTYLEYENGRVLSHKSSTVYQMFNRMDEKFFISGHNALDIKDAEELLSGVPVIKVKPIKKETVNYFKPGDIEEIHGYGLDIFVKLGFEMLQGDILSASKYGVWTYRFEGDPHGFWEVIKGKHETKQNLSILNEKIEGGRLIYHSSSSTYQFSPARNRNRSLWKSSSFLPRQIALLYFLGEEKFFVETEKYHKENDPNTQNASETIPSNLLCLWLIAGLLIRLIKEIFSRTFYLDAWLLMFDFKGYGSTPFKDFKKIVPPRDRFWADPNIIRKDHQYFVFIEEFIHQVKKGQLSVFELDQSGRPSFPVPVLDKEYHLSYPYVFEWDGRYYMVPESAAKRTIDLYECTEFPYKWEFKMSLMENIKAVDTTLLFYHGKWWLFTGISENEESFPEVELFLFYSDDLFTRAWEPHPLNPIVTDVKKARPAGRIFPRDGKLIRPSQDCSYTYGYGFGLNEILVLSETEYGEKSNLVVKPDWDNKITATHTYGIDGQFQIIDAFTMRRKFP
jgi:hypothetical protein